MTHIGYAEIEAAPSEGILAGLGWKIRLTGWARELWHLPDQVLHSRRRVLATAKVAKSRPHSVLFICHGNVCRSPYAAAAFSASLAPATLDGMGIASAGFIGPDRSPPPKALAAARRFGQEMSAHRSRLITSENLQAADLIVVMAADQARGIRNRVRSGSTEVVVLGDLDPLPIRRRGILDPWDGTDADFDSSYGRISRCVDELVRCVEVGGKDISSDPLDDVE